MSKDGTLRLVVHEDGQRSPSHRKLPEENKVRGANGQPNVHTMRNKTSKGSAVSKKDSVIRLVFVVSEMSLPISISNNAKLKCKAFKVETYPKSIALRMAN